jgi:DeoR family transcriptional regulator, fructose operon transcriptional repressor
MESEERQKLIESHLLVEEFASLDELSEVVDVSISTVRRDLEALVEKGIVKRTHGGARLTYPRPEEPSFSVFGNTQLKEKEAIGKVCADIIQPNQTVIIDAGTTCFYVARHLEAKSAHIITNSLPVANHFSSENKVEVVVSGGVIYPKLGVLVGPMAVACFSQVHADVAIMSCAGLTPEGITNSHGLLIEIQRAMMQAAGSVILCVDHTKFGRQSISKLCDLDAIDTLITDELPPPEMQVALANAGVVVIVARNDEPQVIPGKNRSTTRSPLAQVAAPVHAAEAEEETFID